MATIKDVAALAGVSVSTVSIIINGKGLERKISPATIQKVNKAISQLNYQPNIAARRLRSFDDNVPNIAIYIAYDHRSNMLFQFLEAIYNERNNGKYDFNITICPFKSGFLKNEKSLQSANSFNAAIVSTTADSDMEYLKENEPPFPVVLMNRYIEGFSSVCVNIDSAMDELCKIFFTNGYREISAILVKEAYLAAKSRFNSFKKACNHYGLLVSEENVIFTDDSLEGGIEAARKLLNSNKLPKAIYCDTDSIALGLVSVFNTENIRIPEDISLAAVRISDPEYTKYSVPPITVIDLFLEEAMVSCLRLILEILYYKHPTPVNQVFNAKLITRKSCSIY